MTDGTTAYRVRKGRIGTLLLAGLLIFLALSAFFAVVLQPQKKSAVPETQLAITLPVAPKPAIVLPAAKVLPPQPVMASSPVVADVSSAPMSPPAEAVVAETIKPALPELPTGKPLIAILITDLGGNAATAKAAVDILPAAVDLGFEPYAGSTGHMTVVATRAGHAVWVGVPMQPKRYPKINPGKNALLLKQSGTENARRLDAILDQVGGKPAGIYNIMGSAFMANEDALKPIFEKLKTKHNMAFFDMRSDQDSKGPALAKSLDVSATVNQLTLNEDKNALSGNLTKLVRIAKKNGHAVAVINGDMASVEALQAWLKSPDAEAVHLVSAAQMAAHGK